MIYFEQIPSTVPFVEVETSGSGVALVQVSISKFHIFSFIYVIAKNTIWKHVMHLCKY